MAHLLGEMVASGGRYFDDLINKLELLSNQQAIDVDLIGEVLTATNHKLRSLGLVPGDSLCQEVQQALLAKYQQDSKKFAYKILSDNRSSEFIYEQLINELNKITSVQAISIKPASLMRMLSELPPKNTLQELKLKMVEGLFDNYRLGEIAVVVRLNEDQYWLNDWLKQITQLTPDDFEMKPIEVYFMNQELVDILDENISEDYSLIAVLTGTVIVNQKISQLNQQTDNLLALLSDVCVKTSRLAASSNQLQVLVASDNYAKNIEKFLSESTFRTWEIGGELVPWWSIFRAIGRQQSKISQLVKQELPQFTFSYFEPTIWLVDNYPELDFWRDSQFLAFKRNQTITSFNLSDVIDNYSLKIADCQSNLKAHFEESLWDELIFRYIDQPAISDQIIKLIKSV